MMMMMMMIMMVVMMMMMMMTDDGRQVMIMTPVMVPDIAVCGVHFHVGIGSL